MVYHFLVRLVDGGSIESQGRIEAFYNGTWAGVCRSSSSNRQDVYKVVCRQLGYEGAEQTQYSTPLGSEVRMAWLKNVQCAGHESLLLDCKHSDSFRFGSSCSSSYVATAVCTPAGERNVVLNNILISFQVNLPHTMYDINASKIKFEHSTGQKDGGRKKVILKSEIKRYSFAVHLART